MRVLQARPCITSAIHDIGLRRIIVHHRWATPYEEARRRWKLCLS